MKTSPIPALLLAVLSLPAPPARAATPVEVPAELFAGRAATAALAKLPTEPAAAGDVFAYAAVEMLVAVEALGRDFYLRGLRFEAGRNLPVPFLRMQVPSHPAPEPASAADVRRALDAFHGRLAAIDARLEKIGKQEFKTVIPLGAANFDFVGKGETADLVEFRPFFRRIAGAGREEASADPANAPKETTFSVAFDQTDVLWLRAYTQLLRGIADIMLAHDGGDLFAATGHVYFARAETAFARILAEREPTREKYGSAGEIADLISTLHGIDLVVSDPARLARAREELLAMVRLSRETLASAAAEADDDREWLPSPKQSSVFGLRISEGQAVAWTGVLAEFEALLEGKKLLPHWRFKDEGYGLNLRRIFEESRHTDLINLIQGSAAAPYFEQGPTTSTGAWRELMRAFGGNFLGYAVWIN